MNRVELEAAIESELDIIGQDVRGLDLRHLWATRSTFIDVSFSAADLSAARLSRSTFERCDFSRARLAGASAFESVFRDCLFDGADLSGISLNDAKFESRQSDACFLGALLVNSVFHEPIPEIAATTSDVVEPGALIGPVRIEAEIATATSNALYAGVTTIARPTRVLVAVGPRQRLPLPEVRAALLYSVDGMASQIAAIEASSPSFVRHVNFEELPAGVALTDRSPMPEHEAIDLMIQLTAIVANSHELGWTVRGIHPELCFVDGERITGIAGHTMQFFLGMPEMRHGLCLDPYLPIEVWRGAAAEKADDVFGLCALGYFMMTGESPFAAPTYEKQVAVLTNAAFPRIPGPFGHILARGLVADRELRATVIEVLDALRALR